MDKKVIKILENNGVGVLPTDTLYGLVGRALSKKAVERIYKIKGRNPRKPLIILISSLNDLKLFNIKVSKDTKNILSKIWPGKVSIILLCSNKKYHYLHRGTKSLAFRWPKKKSLEKLIKKTGPLVAPSANPEGKRPAETIKEAKQYFKDKIDFYISGGTLKSQPSTLIAIKNRRVIIKRQGVVKINKNIWQN